MTESDKDTGSTALIRPGTGVIVRARNGNLIAYDSSGVVLKLSDRVIDDIALRLGNRITQGGGPLADPGAPPTASLSPEVIEDLVDGLDAWNLRTEGNWLRFSARLSGRQGVRDYLRCADGGGIIADAPGPLFGILGIGGARAALANQHGPEFPYHVLAPADDIGAVGHAGVEEAARIDLLEPLREMTHEALMAEACLYWQLDKHANLPLFFARVETDESVSATALADGMACGNLLRAAANLKQAAARLGKPARLFAVSLDFTLEAVDGDAAAYRDGMLRLMSRIEAGLQELGFDRPVFVARMEAGRPGLGDAQMIEAQWELAWNCGDHRLVLSAPSYMFAHDDYDRPTDAARRHMAEMSAAAASAMNEKRLEVAPLTDGWRCPVFHLAELDPEDSSGTVTLRVIARSLSNLVLEPSTAPGGGCPVGFSLDGDTTGARILSVNIDPADPQTLLISLDRRPAGDDLRLCYGVRDIDGDTAATAIRDDWQLAAQDGRVLHRWALPCRLPIHPGGMA